MSDFWFYSSSMALEDTKRTKRVKVIKIIIRKTILAELQDLVRKRTNDKREVDLELKYVTPLLKVSPEEANDIALRVNYTIKRVLSLIKSFRSAHKNFVEKIKEVTTGGEEEMDCAIGECNTFLKEVEDRVYDVLAWSNSFKFK